MNTRTPEPTPSSAEQTRSRTVVGTMWQQAYHQAARGRLASALCVAGEAALRRQIQEQRERVAQLREQAQQAVHEQQTHWLAEAQKLFIDGAAHVLALDDPRMIEPAIRPLLPTAADALAMAGRETGEISEPALAEVAVRHTMTAIVDVLPSLLEADEQYLEARGA
ncbi:MAG: hypothetical protein D6761_08610 [Candidatus Dadabacteria bacterium]|nr:MAG: hypothetical protein D6761_08610 [Candidatus Dadabacteria bacterium]